MTSVSPISSPRIWEGVLRRLGAQLPAFSVEAWLVPIVAQVDADRLRLVCPSSFHRERVRRDFYDQIAASAAAEFGHSVQIELCIEEVRPTPALRVETARPAEPSAPARPRVGIKASRPGVARGNQIEMSYRFDSFVVGPANALAREASLAIARSEQTGLRSLLLTSDSGMGKTHLARAVVAEARKAGTSAEYTSAEGFTSELVASIRNKRTEQLRRRFRNECSLFVIEDVQFLSGKRATQLELFHTLDHLLDCGARVVMTADRLPQEIPDLDTRLRSRVSSGLVAEIETPDAQLRRNILRRKAAGGGVRVPDACLDHLVESIRGSVRDLEAVLVQVVASASLLKRPVDMELTLQALRKLDPIRRGPSLEIRQVIDLVATASGATAAALASRSRRRDVLLPRQIAMYLCKRYTSASFQEIGRALGRDHSSVKNAVAKVERGLLERAPFRYQVEALAARLEELSRH